MPDATTALDDTIARLTGQQTSHVSSVAASPARTGQGSADGPERDASNAGPLASSLTESQSLPPLHFDGVAWVRTPPRPGEDLDAFDDPLPTQQVDVGWTVASLRHVDCSADAMEPGQRRTGVVVDVEPARVDADTGEAISELLVLADLPSGDGARARGPVRLIVRWPDDVERAEQASRRYVSDVLTCAYRELARGAGKRNAVVGRDRRAWLSSLVVRLEAVKSTKGWA